MKPKLSLIAACAAAFVLAAGAFAPAPLLAQNDLDALMKKVISRRDDNWKKLEQYILNEKDAIEIRGPGQLPVWGERREFTWFLRDGYFVRSPVSANGVKISDAERDKFEANYVRREKEREKRAQANAARGGGPGTNASETTASEAPANVESLIAQTRDPQFISQAYFLKYKFEEGKFALVGREKIDGVDVLKVEYYPARLFSEATDRNARRAGRGETTNKSQQFDQALEQAANKVSLVTLWVEPKASQVVKYVFDNVNLDFLPAQQFVRLNDVHATMQMSQPFIKIAPSAANPAPDVWLPKDIEMYFSMMVAIGQFDMRATINYTDYKLAETSSRIK